MNFGLARNSLFVAALTMALAGCAALPAPQITKEPAQGQRIAISHLNVAIFGPHTKPPGNLLLIGAGDVLLGPGPASYEVSSELANQLPQQLANAKFVIESKKIYSQPGENVNLATQFLNAGSGTFFLTVYEVGSKSDCPIFIGSCGISTGYQVNLSKADEPALWSAIFQFDTTALSSINAEYIRSNLITPIAQEVMRVSQSK